MKAKHQHRVPLCGRALEVLDTARTLGGYRLVFPMLNWRPIAISTLSKIVQQHSVPTVPHGYRSWFRDCGTERNDQEREVIEAELVHVVKNKLGSAYDRLDLFERLLLMDDWAAYLDGKLGPVVPSRPSKPAAAASIHLVRIGLHSSIEVVLLGVRKDVRAIRELVLTAE